ncbi:MAG: polysaccharide biosynthesis/export family protein [Sandaracinaceae bacterium]|nr:polysaccharide biosynthesis/export family protein [Sandaracinaceae bacterium]
MHETSASKSLSAIALAVALVAGPGCGPSAIGTPPPPVANQQAVLGPGDAFDVRVYGEADLSTNYVVQPDGTIDFPYLGSVEVDGLSPTGAAQHLASRLREGGVLVAPHVSIVVTDYTSRVIAVTGAVRRPGNYPVTPGLTGLQAVGLAGGTNELANRNGAIVTRRVDGQMRRYAVPLDRIIVGDVDDVPVQAGDILYVPERIL